MPTKPDSFVDVAQNILLTALRSPRKSAALKKQATEKPHTSTVISNFFSLRKTRAKDYVYRQERRRKKPKALQLAKKKWWKYKAEKFMSQDEISRPLPGSTRLDRRQNNPLRKKGQNCGLPVTKRVLRNRISLVPLSTKKSTTFPSVFDRCGGMVCWRALTRAKQRCPDLSHCRIYLVVYLARFRLLWHFFYKCFKYAIVLFSYH